MADLSTTYMGLALRNPIIVGSSDLTRSVDRVRKCEEAGAGAVVLKSLFEEQIEDEIRQARNHASSLDNHTEADDYIRKTALHLSEDRYLSLIREAKRSVSIPVIASLNCIRPDWWTSYASRMEDAGADGIELNIAIMPTYLLQTAAEIESTYVSIVKSVREKVTLPVAVKIGPHFSSLPHTARALRNAGADALVLFNRLTRFDIDIERMTMTHQYNFSTPEDIHTSLRWIAVLADQSGCQMASATGIHNGAGVIKQLLAGAQAVQVCSVLLQNGLTVLGEMLEYLDNWMVRKGFKSIEEFRGRMSLELGGKPDFYQRQQYIKVLAGVEP
jgi:dihydroorotate dehydrogenase (fumarate)